MARYCDGNGIAPKRCADGTHGTVVAHLPGYPAVWPDFAGRDGGCDVQHRALKIGQLAEIDRKLAKSACIQRPPQLITESCRHPFTTKCPSAYRPGVDLEKLGFINGGDDRGDADWRERNVERPNGSIHCGELVRQRGANQNTSLNGRWRFLNSG